MSEVFLTGATGVLGRRTVPRLVADGHSVSAVARSDDKAAQLRELGASPVAVDLLDAPAVQAAVQGHEAVVHLATHIPTGAAAARKRSWATNDALRKEAAANLSAAAVAAGAGGYVQESITFPDVAAGADWIDENADRGYFRGNRTTVDAEAAAATVTAAGGRGVALRFAMFMAPDSAHMQDVVKMARRGLWGMFGADDDFVSFVDVDDAAAAVVAAVAAPAGVYNVAEPDPRRRGEHRAELAAVVGRQRLRALPALAQRAGGQVVDSLARSHRISSATFSEVAGWRPARNGIEGWGSVA